MALALFFGACSTLPEVKHPRYKFPARDAFYEEPARPYRKLGLVRSKVSYPTLDPTGDDQALCKNYHAKAVADLVKYAKRAGGDAVMSVRSVTFLVDGRHEFHAGPECSDEGDSGEALTQGIAIKWVSKAEADAARAEEERKARAVPPPTAPAGGPTPAAPLYPTPDGPVRWAEPPSHDDGIPEPIGHGGGPGQPAAVPASEPAPVSTSLPPATFELSPPNPSGPVR